MYSKLVLRYSPHLLPDIYTYTLLTKSSNQEVYTPYDTFILLHELNVFHDNVSMMLSEVKEKNCYNLHSIDSKILNKRNILLEIRYRTTCTVVLLLFRGIPVPYRTRIRAMWIQNA